MSMLLRRSEWWVTRKTTLVCDVTVGHQAAAPSCSPKLLKQAQDRLTSRSLRWTTVSCGWNIDLCIQLYSYRSRTIVKVSQFLQQKYVFTLKSIYFYLNVYIFYAVLSFNIFLNEHSTGV